MATARDIPTVGGSATLTVRQVLTPSGMLGPARVEVVDGRVVAVGSASGPVEDVVLAPGFVDLQVNGVDDVDVSRAAGDDWERLDQLVASTGVTAWLPTLITARPEAYAAPLAEIAAARDRGGARPAVLGAHLEGPFLGRRTGAHPAHLVRDPDLAWLASLPDVVRLVTLGPERDGAVAAVEALVARGVVVSLGHSDASRAEVLAAVDAGASMVTHLFNAMGPLHHRLPGIAGAALADDRLSVGLIADRVHVHPDLLVVAMRTKGPGRVALVTDAVAWRASHLGAAGITVADGAPRLPDGTIAGSALTMDAAVRSVADLPGVELAAALTAASTTPARLLGETDRGRIEVGAPADLVALDADDLSVVRTMVHGIAIAGR